MSRDRLVTLVFVLLGAFGVGPIDVIAYQGAATISATTENVEVLQAYIDPGVAGFVIVTVLGFISSIGYWARSHIGRAKRWLFGPGETTTDDAAEASADGSDDGEGENC